MARPRKEIDKEQFEKLCGLQCTEEEIADVLNVSVDTIERWCKRVYKKGFAEVFKQKRGIGRTSLRRMQWVLAEKSPAMAIFLGKQYLGQSDVVSMDAQIETEDDPITKAIKESLGNAGD